MRIVLGSVLVQISLHPAWLVLCWILNFSVMPPHPCHLHIVPDPHQCVLGSVCYLIARLCLTLCDPMEFSRKEYWSGLLFLTPGDLPNPGIEPCLLCLLHQQVCSLPLSHRGSRLNKAFLSISEISQSLHLIRLKIHFKYQNFINHVFRDDFFF